MRGSSAESSGRRSSLSLPRRGPGHGAHAGHGAKECDAVMGREKAEQGAGPGHASLMVVSGGSDPVPDGRWAAVLW